MPAKLIRKKRKGSVHPKKSKPLAKSTRRKLSPAESTRRRRKLEDFFGAFRTPKESKPKLSPAGKATKRKLSPAKSTRKRHVPSKEARALGKQIKKYRKKGYKAKLKK